MFATGIENSIPTINHGKTRVDEMEVCGHYDRWREDFDCVQEIGINYLEAAESRIRQLQTHNVSLEKQIRRLKDRLDAIEDEQANAAANSEQQ